MTISQIDLQECDREIHFYSLGSISRKKVASKQALEKAYIRLCIECCVWEDITFRPFMCSIIEQTASESQLFLYIA